MKKKKKKKRNRDCNHDCNHVGKIMIMIVIMIISGSTKMGWKRRRWSKKGKKVCSFFFLLPTTSVPLNNGEDLLRRSREWQSGRGEEYSQEESISKCQLEEWGVECQDRPLRRLRDSVVSILLAHPDVDPNLKQEYGYTPFSTACAKGKTSCVRLPLQDHRVKVNEPDRDGITPLHRAACFDHHHVIRWWIASEREMNLGTPGDSFTDAIGAAKKKKKTEVVNLQERFESDATKTRSEVRLELGIATG